MEENDLHILLGKQFMITAFIEPRLQIVNYIKDGYDKNLPILINNRFLHFTAHNYYRSVLNDLCALFCNNKSSHKYNFHCLKNDNYKDFLKPMTVPQIQIWLNDYQSEIEVIKAIRDKQIAHYDFEKDVISLNFNELKVLNQLFDLAKRIIQKVRSSFNNPHETIHFDFGRQSRYLTSLEGLINTSTKK